VKKIEIWIKNRDNFSEVLYVSGIKMLFFSIKQFHKERNWRTYENMKKRIEERNLDFPRWWRRISYYYAKSFNYLFPLPTEKEYKKNLKKVQEILGEHK